MWPTVTFGDLLQVKHGFAFKGEFFSDNPGEVVLTPGNFEAEGGLKFRSEKDRSYAGPYPADFRLSAGDLIVVMTDLTQEARILGSAAFVPDAITCLHNQRLGKIVNLDTARLDRRFAYYIFNSRGFREAVKATASGSTVKHTAPGRICAYSFNLPPLPIQRRIASILGAYDDLIEVNRRRIAVLEEMARRLFDEWFVHFRFPGHEGHEMVETEQGRLPKGWTWAPFGTLCADVRDTVAPSEVDPATPYVGLEHIPRRSTTLDAWGRSDEVTSTKHRFQAGDILFGKIRPYFHKVAWAPFAGVCSSDAIVIRPKKPEIAGLVLAVASSDRFVATAVQTSNGTKMPRANWAVLERYPVPLPPTPLPAKASHAVGAWVRLAAALHAANARLAASRDLLLPRLISGDLAVDAAEANLEQAA